MKSLFIKTHVKVFYIQVQFKCKIPPFWHGHTEKTLFRKKKFFSVDFVKINELHVVHT